jgi:hypothetical protein
LDDALEDQNIGKIGDIKCIIEMIGKTEICTYVLRILQSMQKYNDCLGKCHVRKLTNIDKTILYICRKFWQKT